MSLFSDNLNKALVYSSSDLKVSDLKSQEYFADGIDMRKYGQIQQWCQNNNTFCTTQDESDYHFKFGLVYSAPYVIYRQGNIELLNKHILTIVWPRNYSPYATQVMEDLFHVLPDYDLVTISGLAPGVDMMAHEMSIKANIPTIAVLWWGIKHFTESSNREMMKKIVDHGGLILSEFKLDQKPERYTFPQRNRIVAGLSEMVFLPEAGEKSGSLITVDFARQMHKVVYGAPSSMFSLSSKGLLHYMQQWLVQPVVKWEEMLDKYFWKRVKNYQLSVESLKEHAQQWEASLVVQILQKNPAWLMMSELARISELSIEEVMSELSMAEILGQVVNDGGVWRAR
jgi:DNA processing protein